MARKSKIEKYGLAKIFVETYNGCGNNSTRAAEILSQNVNVVNANDFISRQNVDDYLAILRRRNKKKEERLKPTPVETKKAAELLVKDRENTFTTWNQFYDHALRNMLIILEDKDPTNPKKTLPPDKRKPPEEKIDMIETMVNKIMKRNFDFHKIGVPEKGDLNILIMQVEEQVDNMSRIVMESCCAKCKQTISSEIRSLQQISLQHQ